MAGGLKSLLRLLPALAMAGAASAGYAGSDAALPDPTRPPAQVEPAPTGPAGTAAAPVNSGLQTVILREGQKPMAVINGVQVKLGEKVGDATLVKLNESEAVLQGPSGREVLRMTPGIEKTSATPKPAAPQAITKHGGKRAAEKMPPPPPQYQAQ
ncbi:MAG: hypothetical protein HY066_02455 [Betaproteobacteria bacterium]|nr:hypothetical protein [Betaproteobacteria bacterium]